jgi:hypothetical protein
MTAAETGLFTGRSIAVVDFLTLILLKPDEVFSKIETESERQNGDVSRGLAYTKLCARVPRTIRGDLFQSSSC